MVKTSLLQFKVSNSFDSLNTNKNSQFQTICQEEWRRSYDYSVKINACSGIINVAIIIF